MEYPEKTQTGHPQFRGVEAVKSVILQANCCVDKINVTAAIGVSCEQ